MPLFGLNKVLITLLTCAFAMDTDFVHFKPQPRQRLDIQKALKGLKEHIPDISYLKEYDDGVLLFMATPGYLSKVNEDSVKKFLNIPITLSPVNARENFSIKSTISSIFETLKGSRKEFMSREKLSIYNKTYEYLLFEYLNNTHKLITQLQTDIERIRAQEVSFFKEKAKSVAQLTALNLQNSLFHVRCAHLMDYSTLSSWRYEMETKDSLINATYSLAIDELKTLNDILENK